MYNKVSYYFVILQSNWENRKHQKYLWNVNMLPKKSQSGMRN